MCGLWDKDMQKQVLHEAFDSQLSLDKVIRICKLFEAATLTKKALAQEDVPRLAACRKRSSYKADSTPSRQSGRAEVTVVKVVEDVSIFNADLNTQVERVKSAIKRCSEHGITIHLKKFIFS